MDPGHHVLERRTADKVNFRRELDAPASGVVLRILVPPEGTVPPRRDAGSSGALAPPVGAGSQRWVGVAVGGAGFATAAVGLVFGALAKNKRDEVGASCPDNVCPTRAVRLENEENNDSAQRMATLSTIFVGIGAAALVGGAVIFVTARRSAQSVSIAPTGAGARVTFRF